MRAVEISKKLNIAPSAAESAIRGQKMVEEYGLKVLEDDKSVNPRNAHSSRLQYFRIDIVNTALYVNFMLIEYEL